MKIVHKFLSQASDTLNRTRIQYIRDLLGRHVIVQCADDGYVTMDSYNKIILGEFTFDDVNRVIESVNRVIDARRLSDETKHIVITYLKTFMKELEEDLYKSMLNDTNSLLPSTDLMTQVNEMSAE